jgi:hypothetical membrane protein
LVAPSEPRILRHVGIVKALRLSLRGVHLEDRQWAGLILFAGTAQFAIVGLTVAEAEYPGYSISLNYISDLGVGPSALVFNASIIWLGLAILLTAWFLLRAFKDRILVVATALAGIGAISVGVFNENFVGVHEIVSLITFVFAALTAILVFRVSRPPFSYLSVLLGVVSYVALGLYIAKAYAGLGPGGMERMIVWPVLTWGIGFGGYLLGTSSPAKPEAT